MTPGRGWGVPADGPGGVRHEGGVSLTQALGRNVGIGCLDGKGDAHVGGPPERQSTEARRRGGVTHSREEGPVMGLERRGDSVWLYRWVTP